MAHSVDADQLSVCRPLLGDAVGKTVLVRLYGAELARCDPKVLSSVRPSLSPWPIELKLAIFEESADTDHSTLYKVLRAFFDSVRPLFNNALTCNGRD
ncbi:MAG: hypothetical protein DCC65_11345 [Planctomycetota bacterium]|nr:MAG: hypothetical protein DCC65_11345 [Planctomycetota bacterium]